ncbi:Hypothetical_protein [Hexamita inflata]|uniref:Hypothetical_protein n=1 Tax=Hexamita inflata TaxID=28002 RepID=A0ABP1GHK8_9EUKA
MYIHSVKLKLVASNTNSTIICLFLSYQCTLFAFIANLYHHLSLIPLDIIYQALKYHFNFIQKEVQNSKLGTFISKYQSKGEITKKVDYTAVHCFKIGWFKVGVVQLRLPFLQQIELFLQFLRQNILLQLQQPAGSLQAKKTDPAKLYYLFINHVDQYTTQRYCVTK